MRLLSKLEMTNFISDLKKKRDEIIKEDGYQEIADGFDRAIEIVDKYLGGNIREEIEDAGSSNNN